MPHFVYSDLHKQLFLITFCLLYLFLFHMFLIGFSEVSFSSNFKFHFSVCDVSLFLTYSCLPPVLIASFPVVPHLCPKFLYFSFLNFLQGSEGLIQSS